MATNYPIGDFLIQVKNATRAGRREVVIVKTNLIKDVALTLKRMRIATEVEEQDENLTVKLAYRKKEAVLTNLTLISKPGLRIYMNLDELTKHRGPETYILTTPLGVLSKKEAIQKRTGGEVIAQVL